MSQIQIQVKKGHTANGVRKGSTAPVPQDLRTPGGKQLKY